MASPVKIPAMEGAPAGEKTAHEFSALQREPTLSDKVSNSITESIVSGRLTPGQRLPSERDLADQFDVSRTVVREAIRSLIALGLVISQSGRGAQVATIGPDAVSRSMSLFLRGSATVDYGNVHEVRTTLETRIAALAAERATAEDIEELQTTLEEMETNGDDNLRAAQLDGDFHRSLAKATGNALFVVLLSSIEDVLLEVRRGAFEAPGMVEYAIGAHRQILERVEAHDVDGARDAMQEHLDLSERAWSESGGADQESSAPVKGSGQPTSDS